MITTRTSTKSKSNIDLTAFKSTEAEQLITQYSPVCTRSDKNITNKKANASKTFKVLNDKDIMNFYIDNNNIHNICITLLRICITLLRKRVQYLK